MNKKKILIVATTIVVLGTTYELDYNRLTYEVSEIKFKFVGSQFASVDPKSKLGKFVLNAYNALNGTNFH